MIRSYEALRTLVGLIGILLPIALVLGHWGMMPSISQFYYTDMRNLFVSALSVVGAFMFFYVGYDKTDNWLANLAGIFALGVAFFPCEGWSRPYHLLSAVLLFSSFGIFSYFRFTLGNNLSRTKLIRKKLYKICGIVIFSSLIILLSYFISGLNIDHFIFWMEVVMLEAFGLSWLVKGGNINF